MRTATEVNEARITRLNLKQGLYYELLKEDRFLQGEGKELSDNDVVIMYHLSCDPDIQKLFESLKKKPKTYTVYEENNGED